MSMKAIRVVAFLGLMCLARIGAVPQSTVGRVRHGIPHVEIEGREWQIAQYYVNQELLSPHLELVRKPKPYISFAHGAVQGSPGCGRFTGAYRRMGDRLTIEANWSHDAQVPCSEDESDDAAKMLEALNNVRQIGDPPDYWQDDALLLNNAKGEIQVTLSPRKVGNDLSNLPTDYWRLTGMRSSQADLSQVVIHLDEADVSFSTPACFLAFPFEYEIAGLKFSPAWSRDCGKTANPDSVTAKVFERNLHSIQSYQQTQGRLTFFDKDQHALMVLTPILANTIDNRLWRIQKYLASGTQAKDKNGLTDAKSLALISLVNGRVEGSPGCGAWEGGYKLSDGQLTLHAGVMLAGRCYREAEIQSRFVEKAFQGDLRIEQTDDHLLLRDLKGQTQIQLSTY